MRIFICMYYAVCLPHYLISVQKLLIYSESIQKVFGHLLVVHFVLWI